MLCLIQFFKSWLTIFQLCWVEFSWVEPVLSGRVLDSRSSGRGFEPYRRHCVVSLSKNINPSLVLVQPRKTRPFITEILLMGYKESNRTNKTRINVSCLRTQRSEARCRVKHSTTEPLRSDCADAQPCRCLHWSPV